MKLVSLHFFSKLVFHLFSRTLVSTSHENNNTFFFFLLTQTLLLLIIATAEKIFARPQLDLPPLVDPPPLQIFVPDLQLIGDGPELQPQPTQPPPAPSSPPPPPQPSTQAPSAPIVNDYNLKFNGAGDIIGYSYQ